MFHYVRKQCKFESDIPRSLSLSMDRAKLMKTSVSRGYHTVKIIDTNADEPSGTSRSKQMRSKVRELIVTDHLLIVLLCNGVAKAYGVFTGRLRCQLNPFSNTMVHTLVYNNYNDTLIIVYASFPSHLQCKVVMCEKLRVGKMESPPIASDFEAVLLGHPAFFEFCETNGRIGCANLLKMTYTFWDMRTYTPVFRIKDRFQEIRVSDGLVAMFKQPKDNFVQLTLYDIEDGTELIHTVVKIIPEKKMQFLELLVSKLLIKQEDCCLRIYDLLKDTREKVLGSKLFHPNAFVFYDHPSPVNGKVYLNDISKRFFSITKDLLEFWELGAVALRSLFAIQVPGLKDPDLCSHSVLSDILCLYTSNVFDEVERRDCLTSCQFGRTEEAGRAGRSQRDDHWRSMRLRVQEEERTCRGDCSSSEKTEDGRLTTVAEGCKESPGAGVVILEGVNYSLECVPSNREGLTLRNKNAHTLAGSEMSESMETLEALEGCDSIHANSRRVRSAGGKVERHAGALLFFSLSDGQFLNYIPSEVIEDEVEVLVASNDMNVVAIGNDDGLVKIIRNNPACDEYRLKPVIRLKNTTQDILGTPRMSESVLKDNKICIDRIN